MRTSELIFCALSDLALLSFLNINVLKQNTSSLKTWEADNMPVKLFALMHTIRDNAKCLVFIMKLTLHPVL